MRSSEVLHAQRRPGAGGRTLLARFLRARRSRSAGSGLLALARPRDVARWRPGAAALAVATGAMALAAHAEPTYTRVEIEGAHVLESIMIERALGVPVPADSLHARLRAVGRLYYERGFVEAQLIPEPQVDGLLRLRVEEGDVSRLAHVFLRGAAVIPEVEVREILGLSAGDVFRTLEIEARLTALLEAYAHRGYMDAEAVLERLEFAEDGVILGVALAEGGRATLSEVSVAGNVASRPRLVQRLAGLSTPQPADARRIREAPILLRRSGLFADVDEPVLYRATGGAQRLGVLLRVVEAERRNSVFGAVGVARDPVRDRAYLTGAVDLALRNIYGTGRDFAVAWKRDALAGSRLALGYRERFLFGSPLDVELDVEQNVRDSTYTAQSLGTAFVLPLNRALGLQVGGAVDRAVFHVGLEGNTLRLRSHVGMRYQSLWREADLRRFGTLEVRAEYARRRNELRAAGIEDRARVRQTLWSGRFEGGVPVAARHVVAARGAWFAVQSNEAEIPQSELYEFGGARTLRGYREQQFRGDQVAYGGIEYRYGDPRAAQVYAFLDAGALRRKRAAGAREESAHAGYGFGFRARVPSGALDLSFGLGDERSFAGTKVHVSFLQRF